MSVLLLNSSFEPLSVISVKNAFKLIVKGKVSVIKETDKDWTTYTVAFKIPSIVRLVSFVNKKHRHKVRISRKNVLVRDDYTCQYCGKQLSQESATVDHIRPKGKPYFGPFTWDNVATACKPCNNKKDCRTPEEAGMRLLSKPTEPSFIVFSVKLKNRHIPLEEWRDYLYV